MMADTSMVRPELQVNGGVPHPFVPPIHRVMRRVCAVAGISVEALRGQRQANRIVNCRSCVALLVIEFHPKVSLASIEREMNRGVGLVSWYQARHAERLNLYPHYKQLYDYCRILMLREQND